MPHLLWPFFSNNWPLLNNLFRCATRALLRHARKLGIKVGIFWALLQRSGDGKLMSLFS